MKRLLTQSGLINFKTLFLSEFYKVTFLIQILICNINMIRQLVEIPVSKQTLKFWHLSLKQRPKIKNV